MEPDELLETAYNKTGLERNESTDTLLRTAGELIRTEVIQHIQNTPSHAVTSDQARQIAETVKEKLNEDQDLGNIFKENEMPLTAWMLYQTEKTHHDVVDGFIPIPRIKVTDAGVEEYVFVEFLSGYD